MAQTREIPVFPLPVVLYPGMELPLHIFEERYRQMIADIGGLEGYFGVVLAEPDPDCDEREQVHTTGTLARVIALEPLPDGRCNLVCEGLERFHVEQWHEDRPYATADVTVLPEPAGDTGIAPQVQQRFHQYLEKLFALMDLPLPELPAITCPQALAYLLAHSMQLPLAEKQQLLCVETTEERLQCLKALLNREIRRIETQAQHAQAHGQQYISGMGFSLN